MLNANNLSSEHTIANEIPAQARAAAAVDIAGAPPAQVAQNLGLYMIAVEDAQPHERINGPRVRDLTARISAEAALVNPPVAVAYGGKYVILDGATRVASFRRLGYPHIVVQVVDLHTQRVRLDTWHHTLHRMTGAPPAHVGARGDTGETLLSLLENIPGLNVIPAPAATLLGRTPVSPVVGYLLTPDGQGYVLEARPTRPDEDWLTVFNRLVDRCSEWGQIERTLSTDMETLRGHYPHLAGHFIFHRFEAEEVLALAAAGRTVPAGITRFLIPGRILRLNVPLARLLADEPLARKQAWLDAWVGEKIANRQMRYYEEPVILLDE